MHIMFLHADGWWYLVQIASTETFLWLHTLYGSEAVLHFVKLVGAWPFSQLSYLHTRQLVKHLLTHRWGRKPRQTGTIKQQTKTKNRKHNNRLNKTNKIRTLLGYSIIYHYDLISLSTSDTNQKNSCIRPQQHSTPVPRHQRCVHFNGFHARRRERIYLPHIITTITSTIVNTTEAGCQRGTWCLSMLAAWQCWLADFIRNPHPRP